jgi:23S rRNA (cytosine1962-C5)-methyltransferase
MKTWHLKKGGDIRFRQGHPWIFSGELAHSTKDVEAGELVELKDASDHFLAYGTAHPSSNISFRKISGRSKDTDLLSVDFFIDRLTRAKELRTNAGWSSFSHRWVFAEADGLPGLVIDSFKGEDEITVFQVSTAGMENVKSEIMAALEQLGKGIILEASTSSQRKVEGLSPSSRQIIGASEEQLKDISIRLKHRSDPLVMRTNFSSGQKTGFFLDQQANTQLLLDLVENKIKTQKKIKVLDLCCYVGQWSAQIAKLAKTMGAEAQVDLVDSSADALQLAKINCEAYGAAAKTAQLDVMEDWPFEEQYDVVICDPPAFVKKKADLAKAMSGYVKLNREAIRRVKPEGLFVTCSCSGAVREDDFANALNSAKTKAGRSIKWLAHGGHAPDHPILLDFPEGQYLKCWIGQVDFPF